MKMEDIVQTRADTRSFTAASELVHNSFIGIEIELEAMHNYYNYANDIPHWSIVEDGSLRNQGMEFIMGIKTDRTKYTPLKGQDVIIALENFKQAIVDFTDGNGSPPSLSSRTSVHVWIDIRDLTSDQTQNFLLLYMIFEKSLFKFCSRPGDDRSLNQYCVPVWKCPRASQDILSFGQMSGRSVSTLCNGWNKYSAISLKRMLELGGIEFRQHCGTYDTEKILSWINLLLSMKKYAIDIGRILPSTIPNSVSSRGYRRFTEDVFGNLSSEIDYPEIDIDILSGLRLVQELDNTTALILAQEFIVSKNLRDSSTSQQENYRLLLREGE